MGTAGGDGGSFFSPDIDPSTNIDRFQTLVNTIRDGLYQLDPSGQFVAVNEVITERVGYERNELLGSHFSLFLDEDDADRVGAEIQQLRDTDKTGAKLELPVYARDGERIPCELRISELRDADGAFQGTVGVARDISERVEYEHRLERRRQDVETELNEIFGRISDAFYALDEKFRFTHVNERAEELLDDTEEVLIGEVLWERYPEAAEIPEVWNAFQTAMETNESTRYELYFDPLGFWIEANIYPSETGVSVYFRDVTERKERERELEHYESTVETIWDGVATLDDEGRFVMVNEAYCELTGYSRDDLLGEHVATVHGEKRNSDALELLEGDQSGTGHQATLEFEIVREDGERIPVEARFGPYEHDDGSIGRTGVVRDISDRIERERELRQYQTIVESINDGVYVLDEDYHFTLVNDAYCEMTGYDREELLDVHCSRVVGDEISEGAAERSFDLSKADDEFATIDAEIHRKDGGRIPAESRFTSLPSSSGTFEGTVGVVRDLREHREQERALEESERRYRTLVENFPDGAVGLFNTDLRYTAAGGELLDDLYPHVGDPAGDNILERYPSEIVDEIEPYFRAALDGNERSFELEYLDRHLSAKVLPVQDEDGEVFAGLLVVRDITERKERERELERFEVIVETVNDGIYTVDEDGRFTWVNTRYAEMLGYSREELIGKEVSLVVDDAVAESAQEIEDELLEGRRRTPHFEAPLYRADGTSFPSEATFAMFPSEDGHERVGVARDITNRKEHERRLRRQREQLAAVNQLNEVIREISHTVIETSSRSDIEEVVVNRLAEHYDFAWIGNLERGGSRIAPRAFAGNGSTSIDNDAILLDEGNALTGPMNRAIQTREPQFSTESPVSSDRFPIDETIPVGEAWGCASIPIVYDERLFGILEVYAETGDVFDGPEAEILAYLGQVIGHAIYAIEQRMALIGNTVIELELAISGTDTHPFVNATTEELATISFERTIPVTGNIILHFVEITGIDPDYVVALAENVDSIREIELLETDGEKSYFEITLVDPDLTKMITDYGGMINSLRIDKGELFLVIDLPRSAPVRDIVEAIRTQSESVEILAQRTKERTVSTSRDLDSALTERLTEKQRAALETAYFAGFFDWPRTSTGQEVAEMLDLSPATLTEHLRAAERKIFDVMFEPTAVTQ